MQADWRPRVRLLPATPAQPPVRLGGRQMVLRLVFEGMRRAVEMEAEFVLASASHLSNQVAAPDRALTEV